MANITTADDIMKLGTIMVVAAHPDDETFIMGGILAVADINDQKVVCVTATRGEKGVQVNDHRWPADKLGAVREVELKAALSILGVDAQHFLGYSDNECDKVDSNEAAKKIADFIELYNPDSIFTFGPDGLTGHPDHQTVSKWASLAKKEAGSKAKIYHVALTPEQYHAYQTADKELNIFFNIVKPPVYEELKLALSLRLDDDAYSRKLRALKAMPSQYEHMFAKFDEHALRGGFGIEAFIEAE